MALSVVGSSSSAWAAVAAVTTKEVVPNGGETSGDRLYVFASWKDFSVTATCADRDTPANTYTEVTEFADGSVSVGNGTGSMKVGAWYRDWGAGDVIPLVTFSSSIDVATGNCLLLRKGTTETWDTPLFATAAWALSAGPQTTSASSTVAVTNGSVVMCLIGIRDDSATFTRNTTSIDVASGITWNGNYVEQPATHLSTTSGFDMAADLGYRLVTTGGTVTLRTTIDALSATETGSVLWVMQGVTASAAANPPRSTQMTQLLAH